MRQSILQRSTMLSIVFSVGTLVWPAHAEPIVGLTTTNSLISFDSATPGLVSGPVPITGLMPGDTMVAIDFRPATPGVLVGVAQAGSLGRVYEVNPVTGAATLINILTAPLIGAVFDFGIDFNPVANALRIVSNSNQNLRVTLGGTGPTNVDAFLTPSNVQVDAIAYSNNFAGAVTTTLFGMNLTPEPDHLVTIGGANGVPSPNTGILFFTGNIFPVNPAFQGDNGFDISGATGIAYAMFRTGFVGPNELFTINLGTGASTSLGAIAITPGTLRDISVRPQQEVPAPGTLALLFAGLAALAGLVRRTRPLAG